MPDTAPDTLWHAQKVVEFGMHEFLMKVDFEPRFALNVVPRGDYAGHTRASTIVASDVALGLASVTCDLAPSRDPKRLRDESIFNTATAETPRRTS
jgi:hypothetical protein